MKEVNTAVSEGKQKGSVQNGRSGVEGDYVAKCRSSVGGRYMAKCRSRLNVERVRRVCAEEEVAIRRRRNVGLL